MKIIKAIRLILSGEFIINKVTRKRIQFVAFLFVLALIYLANHFHGINVNREISKSEKHIEELRAENIAIQSELLKQTNRRESILRLLDQKGSTLTESRKPPYKIEYNPQKSKKRTKK